MIREIESYNTEVEAEKEGRRCKALLGPGYGYTYKVYYEVSSGLWILDSCRYTTCD